MQAFLPAMEAQRFGRVVNMSSRSIHGKIHGKKARTVYSGTKAALVDFTRSWALEFGEFGIPVNALSPGPVLTELFEKVRIEGGSDPQSGTPDEFMARIRADVAKFSVLVKSAGIKGE